MLTLCSQHLFSFRGAAQGVDQKKLIGKWEYSAPTAPPNYTSGQVIFTLEGDKLKGQLVIEGQKVDFSSVTIKDDVVVVNLPQGQPSTITLIFKLVSGTPLKSQSRNTGRPGSRKSRKNRVTFGDTAFRSIFRKLRKRHSQAIANFSGTRQQSWQDLPQTAGRVSTPVLFESWMSRWHTSYRGLHGSFESNQLLGGALCPAQLLIDYITQCPDQINVGPFIDSSDVISFPNDTMVKNHVDGRGMVFDIEPIPDILSFPIYRNWFEMLKVMDTQRNQLLRKLIGSIIVRTIGNHNRQVKRIVIGPDQVIRTCLRCRIRTLRIVGGRFSKQAGLSQ